MFLAMLIVTGLMGICLLVHYEALRLISLVVPKLTAIPPRSRMLAVMGGILAAHTVEIWIFGMAFYILEHHLAFGGFAGDVRVMSEFSEYVYFSAMTYTSLGLGDVYPTGGLRLVTGAEALLGLLMIAWSASYAYLLMVDLWPLHGSKRRRS